MRKHRGKIIFAAAAFCVLAFAWVFGGNYAYRDGAASPPEAALASADAAEAAEASQRTAAPAGGAERADEAARAQDPGAAEARARETPPARDAEGGDARSAADAETAEARDAPGADERDGDGAETPETPNAQAMVIDPETGKDKYLTDPVPEGKPLPVEPQDAVIGDDAFTATLTVRCDTILANMKLLDKEKHELVPADGVIFRETTVTFYEGESVFNVLQREMKRAGLHMEFENTPIYNSAYIEGINNLYEFDVGELSGWMYKVNGWYPNYGCSRYMLRDGDIIEWHYTCDLGRDLGVYWLGDSMWQPGEE
jgi:hypothetical protein